MRAVGPVVFALMVGGAASQADRVLAGPVVRTIALPTGVTLEYAEQGNPDGVPVVLLHGYSDSRRSWDLVLPHLPARYRVFAISQRGHGTSSKPEAAYLVADFAADVAAFLDAKQIDKAIIIGHSMGSMVAQQVGLAYPRRVQALVLTGAFYVRPDHPVLVDFWNQTVPTRPGIGAITAPTLIIWGDRDVYSARQDQDSLLTKIRGSRLVTYDGIGHAANRDAPERFASDVVAFLDKT